MANSEASSFLGRINYESKRLIIMPRNSEPKNYNSIIAKINYLISLFVLVTLPGRGPA